MPSGGPSWVSVSYVYEKKVHKGHRNTEEVNKCKYIIKLTIKRIVHRTKFEEQLFLELSKQLLFYFFMIITSKIPRNPV